MVVEDLTIDGQTLPSLAYHLWKRPQRRQDTVLALYPFSGRDDASCPSITVADKPWPGSGKNARTTGSFKMASRNWGILDWRRPAMRTVGSAMFEIREGPNSN